MSEYKNDYDRAETMLQQALKKISEGDIEGAENDLDIAKKYLDIAKKETEMVQSNLMFGESCNFGIIYDVFDKNVNTLYESNEGRKVVAKFVKTIKSTPILKEQFNIYQHLSAKPKTLTAEEYLNESMQFINKLNKKEIDENNRKLIEILREGKANEMVDIDDNKIELYEAIEYIVTNDKSMDNIEEYISAKKTIKEYIENIKASNTIAEEEVDLDEHINEMSDKYANELNADEVELIKEITESEDKETVYNKYKKQTLNVITESMKGVESADRVRLQNLHSSISSQTYNPETVMVDVAKYIEISNTLS